MPTLMPVSGKSAVPTTVIASGTEPTPSASWPMASVRMPPTLPSSSCHGRSAPISISTTPLKIQEP